MALALYRKYRPRTFAEVIGQEHVTEPLSQALRSGRLHHAYLFSGPRGCGKTSSARILARSLNCVQGPTPDPCGKCDSCVALAPDGSGSIDVIEIDAASHGGVDDARDLRERAFFAPVASRFKVYVIDEAHMVSSAGFNALLKLVEEPPDYVKFVFATTEPEKVLGTIKSRTHHYPFRLIPPGVLRPYLEQLTNAEGVKVEPAVFPLVVRAGGGSARDTLSVLDQLIAGAGPDGVSYARAVALLGVTDVALIDEMCDALAANDGAGAFGVIDRVVEAGHDPRRFASDLLERLRDLIVLQQVPDAVTKGLLDAPEDQLERMTAEAAHLGAATLSRFADIVHNGLTEMRGTTAPRLLLELICARMLLPGGDDSTGALLQRLERMERRLAAGGDVGTMPVIGHGAAASPVEAAHAASPPHSPAASSHDSSTPGGSTGDPAAAGSSAAHLARAASSGAGSPGAGSSLSSSSAAASPHAASSAAASPQAASSTTAAASAASPQSAALANPAASAAPAHPAASVAGAQSQPAAAPQSTPQQPTPAHPGALDAVAVRRVWDEVLAIVSRKSKRAAAVVREATVRDVDGETLVLVFKHSVHAEMLTKSPEILVEALYELLGGRWQLRCEVNGGPAAAPGNNSRLQSPPARPPTGNPASQPAPAATSAAEEWPTPVQPGGAAADQEDGHQAAVHQVAEHQADHRDAVHQAAVHQAAGHEEAGHQAAHQGAGHQAAADQEAGAQATTGQAAGVQPVTGQAAGVQAATGQAAGPQAATGQAATHRQTAGRQTVRHEAANQPAANQPALNQPALNQPATNQRAANQQAGDWPTLVQPGGATANQHSEDWPTPVPPGGAVEAAQYMPDLGATPAPSDSGSPRGIEVSRAPAQATDAGAGLARDMADHGVATRAGSGHGTGHASMIQDEQAPPAASGGAAQPAAPPAPRRSAAVEQARAAASRAGSTQRAGASQRSGTAQRGGNASQRGNQRSAGGQRPGSASRTGSAWDGAAGDEPPYDPEYDGPAGGDPTYPGFDPGDEPLDDADPAASRESTEEAALRLLGEALGAEKIGETGG